MRIGDLGLRSAHLRPRRVGRLLHRQPSQCGQYAQNTRQYPALKLHHFLRIASRLGHVSSPPERTGSLVPRGIAGGISFDRLQCSQLEAAGSISAVNQLACAKKDVRCFVLIR